MNSNKIGTYVLVGLIIVNIVLISLIFTPLPTFTNQITGFFPKIASTFVNILGVPEPPILRAWTEDIERMGFQNGTVHLNWTKSNGTDVANYLLYETLNYSAGFNFAGSNKTFSNDTTDSIEPKASNYNEIYYVLRANASYDLQDSNTNTWGKYTRMLYLTPSNAKLNLVSTGPMQINKTFNYMFIQNTSNYSVVQVYKRDDVTGIYSIADYYGAFGFDVWWSPDSGFTSMEPNNGYWIKIKNNVSWPVTGNITLETQSRQLYSNSRNAQINLVGWASVVHSDFNDAITQSPTNYNITQVYKRDDVTGIYSIADYYGAFGFDVWWSPDSRFTGFDPGYGYWIKTKQNMTWTYSPNKV